MLQPPQIISGLPRLSFRLLLFILTVPMFDCSGIVQANEAFEGRGRNSRIASAQPNLTGYRQQIAPLLTKYCGDCHSGDNAAGQFALESLDADVLRGRSQELWRSIQFQLQFREMPPADATVLPNANRNKVLTWIAEERHKTQQPDFNRDEKLLLPAFGNDVDHQALFREPAGPVIPSTPRIWRLRPSVYQQAMHNAASTSNIRGLSTPFSLPGGTGLQDFAAPHFIDEPTTNLLLGNAEKLVEFQVDGQPNGRFRDLQALVHAKAPVDDEVLGRAIEYEFRAMLRRGPTSAERERFARFYRKLSSGGDRALAGRTLLTAIIMQPEVLFRQELGTGPVDSLGRQRLSSREIAIAVALALDDRVDADVLQKATDNGFATQADVAKYVRERLQKPGRRTNERILQFFREYFGYPAVTEVFKDRPERGVHEPRMLLHDLEMLVAQIVQQDRDVLKELLTTNRYFILAKHDEKTGAIVPSWGNKRPLEYQTVYNLPVDWKWTADQPISFPATQRSGVLTHPAWLVAFSGNFENHPVQRGKWIRTHLLGGLVPDVPIGVDARIPDGHTPLRKRLTSATAKAECWRCHKRMDPLGLPFEQFNHYGLSRRVEHHQPVDTRGAIQYVNAPAISGEVKSAGELLRRLASSPHVEQVFVRYAFRYFLGRNETLGDAATLQAAHRAYHNNGGSFRELVISLLSSESFLYRRSAQPLQNAVNR